MTQKRYTEIPKRQKCINKEEPYIGGAKDIFDDELNKPQSQVNQEEIANLAAEVQRAQQAEGVLDGKIATEKQRAEGVEGGLNTRLQTVEQLAEISVGGGDIGIGTAADFESDDPEDLAKVPTVGAMLGGANDGVYDISARHSGTKYADLAAALGTNGANVPVGVRKGGMSVKYVQSSDNKYKQFRCIPYTFSINPEDWAFCIDNTIRQNPRFISAEVDKNNKLLSARESDGTKVEFNNLKVEGDIINYKLRKELQSKVVKEEGKELIPTQFIQEKENPEFIEAKLDKDGKLIEGTKTDGSKYFGGDVKSEGKMSSKEVITDKVVVNGAELSPTSTVDVTKIVKDPEERLKVDIDKNRRIISYRDKTGALHETVGLFTESLHLSKDGLETFKQELDITDSSYKAPHLPKYGTVNITQETFYLVKTDGVSSLDDVHIEQVLVDTAANAKLRLAIGRFFKNGTSDAILNFASSDVHEENGVFYATTKVKKINNICYYQNTLGTSNADHPVRDTVVDGYSIVAPYDANLPEGGTKDVIFEVNEYSWVPDIRVWFIDKSVEHHCLVDINFGYFLSKTNVPVGIKFQGSSTTTQKKKNFRFTFYKKANYAKKDKIKIGEMVRLSGYNLKANSTDNTRIKEYILYAIILSIWNKRPIVDRFAWDKKYGFYTGATGFIKGFPISTYIGGNFYGMHIFSLKKDERNYMLDGDDDNSGIFVSGTRRDQTCWTTAVASDWEDEMMDDMSQDTADALNTFFAFINDRLVIDNVPIEFNKDNIPDRMDVQGFIDYFICLQGFLMWDSICRNVILYSGSDKKKFYPFFYDLDLSMQDKYPYNVDIFDIEYGSSPSNMYDMSLWANIKDLYWDEIVNRWCELRNTVLSNSYILDVYNSLTESIPQEDFDNENIRWSASVSKVNGEVLVEKIIKRLDWLDINYFIV